MPEKTSKPSARKSSHAEIHDQVPQRSPVNALNLEAFCTKADCSERVRLFIAAQTSYARVHAQEGRAELASWKSDGTPRTPPKIDPLVSVFDTPILKPRVPGTELGADTNRKHSGSGPSASRVPQKTDQVHDSKDQKERSREGKQRNRRDKGKGEDDEQNDRPEETKRPAAARKLKPIPVAPSKKRPKTPTSSELEHVARLADRRERKRARREIVKPAPIASSSVDKENDGEDDVEDGASLDVKLKKPTKGGKAKPAKKKKVPAGMALLYGFSAPNVGTNRLTMKPSQNSQYGVFNRGRASSKAQVSARPRLARGALFSEERFLSFNRSRPATGPSLRAGRLRRLVDDEEVSSRPSTAASVPAVSVRTKPITGKGSKRRRSPSSDVELPNESLEIAQEDSCVATESAPWDIEDGRSLASQATSASSPKEPSAVMDIRQHRLGKLLATSAIRAEPDLRDDEDVSESGLHRETSPGRIGQDNLSQEGVSSRQPTRGTVSTIAPSESASQVLKRAQNVVTGMQLSKYFTRPRKPPTEESRPTSAPPRPIPTIQPKPPVRAPQAAPVLPSPSLRSHSLSQPLPTAVAQVLPVASSPDVKRPSSADSLDRALKAMDVPDPSLRVHFQRSQPSARRPVTAPDIDPFIGPQDYRALETRAGASREADAAETEVGTQYATDEYGRVNAMDVYVGYSTFLREESDDFGHEDRPLSAHDVQDDPDYAEEEAMMNVVEYIGSEHYRDAEGWVAGTEPVEDGYAVDEYDGYALREEDSSMQYANDQTHFEDEWSDEEVRAVSQTPGPADLFLRTSYHAEEDVARQLQGHWRPQTY
ncbi:unnamed protein product [Peniophora sp. CBMAI 1063]|nr:unnamed protein product [Peniophora sp. CBMAI 1063]